MDNSFDNALAKFRASLTEGQRRDFGPCTLKDVQIAIEEVQARLGSQRRLRNMNRITRFIEGMTQLGQVVEVFLNVDQAVALVWGPIKFVLLAASTWVETLDLILDTYTEIGEILPGMTQFRGLLGKYPNLKVHLENYYRDVLDFHRNALDVFSRPMWKAAFHSAWKTFRSKFGPILSSLKRHRDIISDEKLSIALSQGREFRESVEEKLERLSRQMEELRLEEKEQQTLKLQEQRNRQLQFVLNKFDAANYPRNIQDPQCERRHQGSSGDWIFRDPQFNAWADLEVSRNNILYLSGIPGAGKTVLTSKVVEHLNKLKTASSARGRVFSVVYFYFNHTQPDKRSLPGLLLGLLSQLIHQDDIILEQIYQRCLPIEQQKIQSLAMICELASIAFKSLRLCFVILDGLDECVGDSSAEPGEEQTQVIDWFKALMRNIDFRQSDGREGFLRLFLSGQRNGILERQLRMHPSIQLETKAGHMQDIRLYAEQRSVEMHRRFNFGTDLERDLVERVASGAKGMFLYAKIVLGNLFNQVSMYNFKQELRAEIFPKGLDEAYERVVIRIFENPIEPQRVAAIKILGFLICAKRSLMWKEIQSIFCIDLDDESADPDRQLIDSCKGLCGSLVEVELSEISEPNYDISMDLVHHTASVYLVQSGRLCILEENAKMALFCARYITSFPFTLGLGRNEIENHALTGYYGFLDYASAFWAKHVYEAVHKATNIDVDIYDKILHAAARVMDEYGNQNDAYTSESTPSNIVKRHIEEIADDVRGWENSFPIEFRAHAIRNILETLLSENGALRSQDSVARLYGAVQYKCHKPWCQSFTTGFKSEEDRHRHILEHERPFRCSVDGCFGKDIGFPSELTLRQHNERFHSVQSTIQFDPPPRSKSKARDIVIAAAAGDLHEVKACHLSGISIDLETKRGTALYCAVEQGHMHICRYLLKQGANVNCWSPKDREKTALHVAALADNAKVTKLLLSQREVEPNLKDRSGFTAAGCAAARGCNVALSVFISQGLASKPGQDNNENTCMDIAIRCGNLQTARLLINDTSYNPNTCHEIKRYSGLPLHYAAEQGSVEIFNILLSNKRVDVEKADRSGRQALHYACQRGEESIVKLLLPSVAGLNTRDKDGKTPLQLAVISGHRGVARMLLDKGADPNDHMGLPVLISANGSDAEVAKLLLDRGADLRLVNESSESLLIRAIDERYSKTALILLDRGADPNSTTKNGQMAFLAAFQNGLEEVAVALLQKGADLSKVDELTETARLSIKEAAGLYSADELMRIIRSILNTRENLGFNGVVLEVFELLYADAVERKATGGLAKVIQLFLMAKAGQSLAAESLEVEGLWSKAMAEPYPTSALTEVMNLLLIKGADLNFEDELLVILKPFLEKGTDLNIRNRFGDMFLHSACRSGLARVAIALVENGANLNSKDALGCTPLLLATEMRHSDIAKLLLERGADPNSRDRDGRTPMSLTITSGDASLLLLLLGNDLDPNSDVYKGHTSLSLSSEMGRTEMVKILLENGADPNLYSIDGRMAMSCAAQNGHTDVVKLLVKNGADPNLKDLNGWTPIVRALQNGHTDVVETLLNNGADPSLKGPFRAWTASSFV